MFVRSVGCLVVLCAVAGHVVGVLQTDYQYKSEGACTYQGHRISQYSEYTPVYDPAGTKGCVRVLCKDYDSNYLQMDVHSCNPEYVDGRQVEMWPGRRYPDCCRKLRY